MRATRHRGMRWILQPEISGGSGATGQLQLLTPEKLKHLRGVLRMEWDEEVRVTDGGGHLYRARLEKKGDQGGLRLLEVLEIEAPSPPLALVICLPKNATMDWAVEKAVECGVSQIIPVVSSRSVVQPDSRDSQKYSRRWQAIADEAVEQSERLWRPEIAAPIAWKEWVSRRDPADSHGFIFVTETRERSAEAAQVRETWRKLGVTSPGGMSALIGPEGGFSEEERAQARAKGFEEVSLGATVLRVETAVVAALTLARVCRLVSSC